MAGRNDATEMERLIEAVRGMVGALNAGHADASVPVALARLETRVGHVEKALSNIQRVLVGLAVSVLGLLAKMLVEGALR